MASLAPLPPRTDSSPAPPSSLVASSASASARSTSSLHRVSQNPRAVTSLKIAAPSARSPAAATSPVRHHHAPRVSAGQRRARLPADAVERQRDGRERREPPRLHRRHRLHRLGAREQLPSSAASAASSSPSSVRDDERRAERLERVGVRPPRRVVPRIAPPERRDRRDAHLAAHLDRGAPHRGHRRVQGDGVSPRAQADEVPEHAVRGGEVDDHLRGELERDALGHRAETRRRHGRPLAPRPEPRGVRDHPGSRGVEAGRGRVDALAERVSDADALVAADGGERRGRDRVRALDRIHVRGVRGGGEEPDGDLAGARGGAGDGAPGEDVARGACGRTRPRASRRAATTRGAGAARRGGERGQSLARVRRRRRTDEGDAVDAESGRNEGRRAAGGGRAEESAESAESAEAHRRRQRPARARGRRDAARSDDAARC